MVIKNAFMRFSNKKKALRQNPQSLDFIELMAERVGFEPTVPVKGHLISSQAPSTTRTPLQMLFFTPLPKEFFHNASAFFLPHSGGNL